MFSAIVLGGGSGERMGLGYNKVLYKIKGKTVIEYAVEPFIEDEDFTEVIVVMNRDDYDKAHALFNHSKIKIVKGGATRQESVYIGLTYLNQNQYVFIHDGARPLVSKTKIDLLKQSVKNGPSTLFTPAKESIVSFKESKVSQYLDRNQIGFIKTPQAFKLSEIIKAYDMAKKHKNVYTDDASLIMNECQKEIYLIEDDASNIKLTTHNDLKIMEVLL